VLSRFCNNHFGSVTSNRSCEGYAQAFTSHVNFAVYVASGFGLWPVTEVRFAPLKTEIVDCVESVVSR